MKVLAGSNPTCLLARPDAGRRLHFRNAPRGRDSLRRRSNARPAQVRRSQSATRTQCAAAPSSQAAGKRGLGSWPIDVKAEQQPASHLKLTVTLPAAMVKRSWDDALNNLRNSANFPGFRKGGKMPVDVLLSMAEGGASGVKQAAIENMLQMSIAQALKKWEEVAINDSVSIDTPIVDLIAAFDVAKPLQYDIGVDLAPAVSWKSSYRDISVQVEAAASEASDRAAVENMLRLLQKEQGTLRVVVGRGVQRGDVAIIDFDAQLAEEGAEPVLCAKRTNLRLDTDTADTEFLPGLLDGMLGMNVGEERAVPVSFPQTWEPEQLRGKDAICTVAVKELFEWTLPELADEFICKVIPACSSLVDAREKLFEAQVLKSAEVTQQRVISALSEEVAAIVEADVPRSLLKQMGQQEYQKHLLNLQQEGKINMEVIQSLASEQMLENYVEHKKEKLEQLNRAVLGFETIFQQEGLEVTDAEVQAEFELGAKSFADGGQEFDAERLREQAVETVRATKVLEFLKEACTIDVKPYQGA